MFRFNDEGGGGDAGGAGGSTPEAGGTPGDAGGTSVLGSTGSPGGDPGNSGSTLPDGAFMLADFKAALPEEVRNNAGLGKIDSLENMARSFLAGQRMIGKDPTGLVELPKSDASFEDRRAVMTKLGAPEKADGYKLTLPTDAPPIIGQALNLDTPLGKAFLETSVKMGVLPEQAQGYYEMLATHLAAAAGDSATNDETTHTQNIEALKTEAGGAFDDWIRAATFGISKIGGDPLRDALNDAGLGTNPVVVKAMMQVGKLLAEDTASGTGGTGGQFGALAPGEARARAKELLGKAATETNVTEKKRLGAEAQKFFAMATGEKPLPA